MDVMRSDEWLMFTRVARLIAPSERNGAKEHRCRICRFFLIRRSRVYEKKLRPPMTVSVDFGGRETTYGIDKRFLFSGCGSVKLNFLSTLLDFIPGASQIKSAFGIYSLTLSGDVSCEWLRLISSISAPCQGVTSIEYDNRDLSSLTIKACDYFLGLFSTAMNISYEILYKHMTESVTNESWYYNISSSKPAGLPEWIPVTPTQTVRGTGDTTQ